MDHLLLLGIVAVGPAGHDELMVIVKVGFGHAQRAEDIVVARNAVLHAVVAVVGKVEAFGKQLFPAIFAVRIGRIGRILDAVGIVGIQLIVFGIHARGRAVEHALDRALVARIHAVVTGRSISTSPAWLMFSIASSRKAEISIARAFCRSIPRLVK